LDIYIYIYIYLERRLS